MKTTGHLKILATACAVMLAAFAGALTWSCRGSDQVAPEGATIHLAANPATIPFIEGSGQSDIVATVSSSVGVPQKDQDVRFTSNGGSLFTPDGDPGANIPIRTDDLGNAHVRLTINSKQTVTVSARSGTAIASLDLRTEDASIASVILNFDFTPGTGCVTEPIFRSCSDELCLRAQVLDINGSALVGVVVVFKDENFSNTAGDPFGFSFVPTEAPTEQLGGSTRIIKLKLGNNCPTECANGETCEGDIFASTQSGTFESSRRHFTTEIE